jgi:hypothetical protein
MSLWALGTLLTQTLYNKKVNTNIAIVNIDSQELNAGPFKPTSSGPALNQLSGISSEDGNISTK